MTPISTQLYGYAVLLIKLIGTRRDNPGQDFLASQP
jgi:hypothetical protein